MVITEPVRDNHSFYQRRLLSAIDIRLFLDERRNQYKQYRRGSTDTCEQPEEAGAMELSEKTAITDIRLDNRNQYVTQCNRDQPAGHDG